MAKTLLVLNEQPYGGERSYNGLRMTLALLKAQGEEVRIFLIGDAELVDGTQRSTMAELAEWHQWADKAIAF